MVLYVERNHMSFQLWVGDDANSNGQYFQVKTTALEKNLQDSSAICALDHARPRSGAQNRRHVMSSSSFKTLYL